MAPSAGGLLLCSAGLASACLLGLLLARAKAHELSQWILRPVALDSLTEKAVWDQQPLLTQFVSYVVTVALAFAGAGAFALVHQKVVRSSKGRAVLVWSSLAAAIVASFATSFFLGKAAVCMLAIASMVIAAGVSYVDRRSVIALPRVVESYAVAGELVCLFWGVWLTLRRPDPNGALGWIAVLAVLAAMRWRGFVAGVPSESLRRDALAGSLFCLLPLAGLLRAPSPWLVALAVALVVALRVLIAGLTTPRKLPDFIPSIAVPLGLLSIVVIPLQLRELSTINHMIHEAQHLGWVASALQGKFMMADASTTYPPLREYLLVAYLRLTSVTVEQMRIGGVLFNLAGLGVLLWVGWRLVGRSLWLHAWYACLLVTASPLRYFLSYWSYVSFGWIDLLRCAASIFMIAGAVQALATPADQQRALVRRLVLYGAGTGVALLYSHEFGLCALLSTLVALGADRILRSEANRLAPRLKQATIAAGCYGLGFAGLLALWLLPYAIFGKASLFLRTFYVSVALPASGAFGSKPLPITGAAFLDDSSLLEKLQDGFAWEYLCPVAIYILTGLVLLARLAWGRWTVRSSLQLALLLFGLTSFRIATARADFAHLVSASTAAIVLFAAMAGEANAFSLSAFSATLRLPLGKASLLLIALFSLKMSGYSEHLSPRIFAILRGDEAPSFGPPYVHEGLPRAGDVKIPPHTADLARYIVANTDRKDAIFSRIDSMDGPELYFLAKRRNPTRFDMLAEITWRGHQEELFESLKRDPPKLVIGSHGPLYVGKDAHEYLLKEWTQVATFGSVAVFRRNDETK